jgi:hypothetical protein
MFLRLASHYREAFSMMGEAGYDATDITRKSVVKFVLFRCEIQLNDASDLSRTGSLAFSVDSRYGAAKNSTRRIHP